MNLEFNVFIENDSRTGFRIFNVFNHYSFAKDLKENVKTNGRDRAAFEERLKMLLMYYFWSKCEYEIIVSSWPPSDKIRKEKVDAYDQVMMNWDIFRDYVWEHLAEIKKMKVG